jgi:hypothetical protein
MVINQAFQDSQAVEGYHGTDHPTAFFFLSCAIFVDQT